MKNKEDGIKLNTHSKFGRLVLNSGSNFRLVEIGTGEEVEDVTISNEEGRRLRGAMLVNEWMNVAALYVSPTKRILFTIPDLAELRMLYEVLVEKQAQADGDRERFAKAEKAARKGGKKNQRKRGQPLEIRIPLKDFQAAMEAAGEEN